MRFYFKLLFFIALVFLIYSPLFPQEFSKGTIKGTVSDEAGNPLYGANIQIESIHAAVSSGADGSFTLDGIQSGTYTLTVTYVGYKPHNEKVTVASGKTTYLFIKMKITSFQIGGIDVIASEGMLPSDAASSTKISSGEIEHYQAVSVQDVLDLVPGITKTDNPGIATTAQAALRGDHYDETSALGTLIILDGTPVSNNANLQFEKFSNTLTGKSNTGGGVDLRTIPADNIESIEVVSGLPSVRYGDQTEGVIRINTKMGPQPNRLKIKQNPSTKEANFGGGTLLSGSPFTYNLNYARSERDKRVDGDEFSRLSAQIGFASKMLDGRLTMNQKISGQQLFDYEEPHYSMYETRNYNKSWSAGYSNWGKLVSEDGTSFWDYNAYLNLNNQNTMRSNTVTVGGLLLNGDTVASYRGVLQTIGKEWNTGGRLEWNNRMITGSIFHNFTIGTEVQYNANTGRGIVLDSVYNYFSATSPRRSYTFDDIPGQTLLSFYAADMITFHLGVEFRASLGFRYEMYRPYDFNFKGFWGDGDLVKSRQGSFFNPRFSLIAYLSKDSQIRLSAGASSKSPAMSSIYGRSDVYRWKNTYPDTTILKVLTFNPQNPDLKGTRELMAELSYDHKFKNLLTGSVNLYYKERTNETVMQDVPYFFYYKSKSGLGYINIPETNYYPLNLGWTYTKGAEIILKSTYIKPLNMTLQVNTSYIWSDKSRGGFEYNSSVKSDFGQKPNYKVPGIPVDTMMGFQYAPSGKWYDRLQMNYYVTYTNKTIGLWLTLRAQNLISYRFQSYNLEPRDYARLSASQKTAYDYAAAVVKYTPKWLFNLSISKSLFKGAEMSFYVNNFLDDPGLQRIYATPTAFTDDASNPSLFYGLEFSCSFDRIFEAEK